MSSLVEQARVVLSSRPDLAQLLDDSVISHFELTPLEAKVFAALLVEDGNALTASERCIQEGMRAGQINASLQSLEQRELVARSGPSSYSLEPAQQRLRVELPEEPEPGEPGEPPDRKVVLRPLREVVCEMAASARTPAAGLGRVYAFLYGRRPQQRTYGLLGKLASLLGVREGALFLLEHCSTGYAKDPLVELIPLAVARSRGWRPEDAPDEAEQRREREQAESVAWRQRMQRWFFEYGGKEGAIKSVNEAEFLGRVTPDQAGATKRQISKDFERWEQEGRPALV